MKLQIYRYESLVATDNQRFSDLKEIELSESDWDEIFALCENISPKLIVEPFDYDSFLFAKSHQVIAAYKIPTSDLLDKAFVKGIFAEKKPVFIATGGTTVAELDDIMKNESQADEVEVILLHGFQNFPTRLEDSLLNKIRAFRDRYDCRVGFADHVDADDDELARTLPSMAIAAGASVIEKHLTLDRSERGFDYYSALNPDEFMRFVKHVKTISTALGEPDLNVLSDAEKSYRDNMKKFAIASRNLEPNETLSPASVNFRRTTSKGLTHSDLETLWGKRLARAVREGSVLEGADFDV